MNKLLSQEEVNVLLNGIDIGNIKTAPENVDDHYIKSYNFTNYERIIRGRMPGLELVNERFARLFMNSLSSKLTRFVDVIVQDVNMMKFNEFIKTMPLQSSINIFKIEPLHGNALFVIEASVIFMILECFFGSNNIKSVKVEDRSFTFIEQGIIKKFVDLALRDVEVAWKGIADVQLKYIGVETNPRFITIATLTEAVISIEIKVTIEEVEGKIILCIPYLTLEPIKEKLYSSTHNEYSEIDKQWTSQLMDILNGSSVKVTAKMGAIELTVEDILNLEIGNVINIGKSITDEIDITVEDVLKFKGIPCVSKGSQAIRITNFNSEK
jgi:flagellar motor switch protein FliM